MYKFDLADRYRLDLKWKKAIYEQEGICKLQGAYFSGPALAEAQRINNNDHIMVDFFKQYYVIAKNVYVAKLSWGEVVYFDGSDKVYLKDAMLTHDTELNRVPKLNNMDFIILDTSDHVVERHPMNLTYKAFVVNNEQQLYNFGDK